MNENEDDRGQFGPVHYGVDLGVDGLTVMVVHAVFDQAELDAEADKMMAALHARGIAIMKCELGRMERFTIKHVSPEEFMKPDPPTWPNNIAKGGDPASSVAQWKRERSRYRFRSG
ncbi:MAG TPA: hypothetical protein VGE36_13680 [Roseateles sp.]